MNKRIVCRTAGGIGNQLFQIAAGLSLAEFYQARLVIIHDKSYSQAHCKFQTSLVRYKSSKPKFLERLISCLRIPKFLTKFVRNTSIIKFGNTFYMDGYFQDLKFWRLYADKIPWDRFENIDSNMGLNLLHIRLGDFFNNDEDRTTFLLKRISKKSEQWDLISNSEALADGVLRDLDLGNIRLKRTSSLSPDDLLRFIGSYSRVDSNESTIAFWAVLLGGGVLEINNVGLASLFELLRSTKDSHA